MANDNDAKDRRLMIDPILGRWRGLTGDGYEIDVGTELWPVSDVLDESKDPVSRTYFPSGFTVPKRFELLSEKLEKRIVQYEGPQLVRRQLEITIGSIVPLSLFGMSGADPDMQIMATHETAELSRKQPETTASSSGRKRKPSK